MIKESNFELCFSMLRNIYITLFLIFLFVIHLEPPPPVSDEVRELLEQSRPKYIGPKWIRPKIAPWKFRLKKIELIAAGHYFPEKPMRDRMLDPMPKVQRRVIKKEERLVKLIVCLLRIIALCMYKQFMYVYCLHRCHVHTHIIYTYMHASTHTRKHTYTQAHIHMHTHSCCCYYVSISYWLDKLLT